MYVHKHQTQISEVSPLKLNTAFVNREHKPRACWHLQPLQLIDQYMVGKKKRVKKEATETIWKKKKIIMSNTSAIWQQTAHTAY